MTTTHYYQIYAWNNKLQQLSPWGIAYSSKRECVVKFNSHLTDCLDIYERFKQYPQAKKCLDEYNELNNTEHKPMLKVTTVYSECESEFENI